MPKVYNIQMGRVPKHAVLVDRSTVWGNPFVMRGEDTREWACNEHETWLQWWAVHGREIAYTLTTKRTVSNKWVVENIHELTGRDLVCHCAPKRCHADTLLRLANETDEKRH